MGRNALAIVASVALLSGSAGCMSGMTAARNKHDPINAIIGLPLNIALSYGVVGTVSAIDGNGFNAGGASVLIGAVVFATLDAFLLPGAIRDVD